MKTSAWKELDATRRSFVGERGAAVLHRPSSVKGLMPVRAKRSKSGAVSFDLIGAEDGRAAIQ
jgi:hypothetical protein